MRQEEVTWMVVQLVIRLPVIDQVTDTGGDIGPADQPTGFRRGGDLSRPGSHRVQEPRRC